MHVIRPLAGSLVLFTLFAVRNVAEAQPPDFSVTTVASGINAPTAAAFLPDGRLLVAQKDGHIRISTTPVDQAPVTLTNYMVLPVDNSAEHGLVGLWISPYFATDSAVFVYRSTGAQRNRLSTFKHLGASALPSSETLIWETPVYTGCCHTGGAFAFLPDTTILLAVGDDYTPANAQDMTSAFGKLHRFRWDGSAPDDNPFADGTPGPLNANGVLKTIYCSGLRNPFRGHLDPETGRFLIGTVGANNHALAWEDVHLAAPGANFGWPLCGELGRLPDGTCDDPAFTDPLITYPHLGLGAAITGGATYRGTNYPGIWNGRYFYGDFIRGWVKWAQLDALGAVVAEGTFMDTTIYGGTQANFCTQLLTGPGGDLFYLSYYDLPAFTGSVKRVSYVPGSGPQCVSAEADPTLGVGPQLTVAFNAQAVDPLGGTLSYTWSWSDGTPDENGSAVQHTFLGPGSFVAELQVANALDTVVCASIPITVLPHEVEMNVDLLLDGPFEPLLGWMRDELRVQGLVPEVEPYSDLGLTPTTGPGATLTPGALNNGGPEAVVDWILIELRDAVDPAVLLDRTPALLQRNGQVVSLDGVSPLIMTAPARFAHVAVRHRNHLSVMSAMPLDLGSSTLTLDLRDPATACFGTDPRRVRGSLRTLWTGNATLDGKVSYVGAGNDRDAVLVSIGGTPPTAVSSGYLQADVNLDGLVKYTGSRNDRDQVLVTIGGVAPSAVRLEQLP
ncbi:MAG TPA: PQQ-dependent sugar dehydrogenase [Flavobacteriales bacterium]|nr:PQQ-dependent sugar dehydrogenase [Flavobacteriales bacterium]HQW85664.1 PQQ-dependent sugar dehydrogenase [Flavobacteriales bacterium]